MANWHYMHVHVRITYGKGKTSLTELHACIVMPACLPACTRVGPRSKVQDNNSSKGGGVSGGDGVLQGSADVGCCERMEQGVEGGGEGSAKAKEGVSGGSAEGVPRDSQSSSKSGEVHVRMCVRTCVCVCVCVCVYRAYDNSRTQDKIRSKN